MSNFANIEDPDEMQHNAYNPSISKSSTLPLSHHAPQIQIMQDPTGQEQYCESTYIYVLAFFVYHSMYNLGKTLFNLFCYTETS